MSNHKELLKLAADILEMNAYAKGEKNGLLSNQFSIGNWYKGQRHGQFCCILNGHFVDLYFLNDKKVDGLDMLSEEEKILFQLEHPDFRFLTEEDIQGWVVAELMPRN